MIIVGPLVPVFDWKEALAGWMRLSLERAHVSAEHRGRFTPGYSQSVPPAHLRTAHSG
jgi:hypothetical protein